MNHATRTTKTLAALLVLAVVGVGLLYGGYRYVGWTQTRVIDLDRAVITNTTIDGEPATIAANDDTGPRPLMLFMHGYGADHTAMQLPRTHDFTQQLIDQGFIVAAADAHNNDWGGPATQAAYVDLYEAVAARYEVSGVVVVSESMGTIAAARLLADGSIPGVKGWVAVSPVLDLKASASKAPLADAIGADIGNDGVAVRDLESLTAADFDIPAVVYLGDDDNVVFAADVRPAADRLGMAFRSCDGAHVAKDCFRPEAVAAFVN